MTSPSWVDVGNVTGFDVTPNPEVKEHYSSRTGTRELDKIAIVSKKAEFTMGLEEVTLDNLTIATLGLDTTAGDIEFMGATSVERQLKFDGTNNFGARVEIILPHVFLLCKDKISFIGADWTNLTITGSILRQNVGDQSSAFGTIAFLDGATGNAPLMSPNTLNYQIGQGIVYLAPIT